MKKKLILIGLMTCLAMSVALSADAPNVNAIRAQLDGIDQQMKSLMAAKQVSVNVVQVRAQLQQVEQQRNAVLASIPELKAIDAEGQQLAARLTELQRTRAALIQQRKGAELAALDAQKQRLHAAIAGMDDPAICALAQQRLQLMQSLSAATKPVVKP